MAEKNIFDEYGDEVGAYSFTKNHDRSFHGESWTEETTDFDTILKFAEWYASQKDKTFANAIAENKRLKKRNDHLENMVAGAINYANCTVSFLNDMLPEDKNGI